MSATTMEKATSMNRLCPIAALVAALSITAAAHAAAPGIAGNTFNLTAQPAYMSQPDGNSVYSWGYGGSAPPAASAFVPNTTTTPFCNTMQVPGPTLVVTEGQTVSVTLTNALPTAAGNTSILFPGFTLTSTCPAANQGLLTCEAAPGGTVTYTFVASSPGTRAYYSGTQRGQQFQVGLYGAIIVLPNAAPTNGSCPAHNAAKEVHAQATALVAGGESDFRLSPTH